MHVIPTPYTGSDKNIFLRKEKTVVKVTKFEINEDDRLIVCPGQLVVGRLGVHRIGAIKIWTTGSNSY